MDDATNSRAPAFPTTEEHGFNNGEPGMTLRDYFAAKAMHMVFEKAIHNWKQDGEEDLKIDFEFVAESAYLMADAMLKAKEIA